MFRRAGLRTSQVRLRLIGQQLIARAAVAAAAEAAGIVAARHAIPLLREKLSRQHRPIIASRYPRRPANLPRNKLPQAKPFLPLQNR